MRIESKQISVNTSTTNLFKFLEKTENFKVLMPDNISKFETISDNEFVFALTGMPEIFLKKDDDFSEENLLFKSSKGKIDFTLKCVNENKNVKLVFQGDINAMMAMMIKKPITNFIETLIVNLQKQF